MRKFLSVFAVGALAVAGTASTASAQFTTTDKTWEGLVWTHNQTDYGTNQSQLNAGNFEIRNSGGTGYGFAPYGSAGGGQNNLATANKSFWEKMRTSSIPGAAAGTTSPWFSWTVIMNYTGGTSQNDMTANGVGGNVASSVASGTLSPEPGHFGGDRFSIGSSFGLAHSVEHKGTGLGTNNQHYRKTPGGTGAGDFSATATANSVVRPGVTGAKNAVNFETVKWTIGKRLNGTTDVILEAPSLLSGTKLHTSTFSNDNPNWFFYMIEFRWRGNTAGVAPTNSVQTYLDFSYGNNWGTINSNANSVIPEPASMGLLALGSLLIMARRRKA